MQKALNCFKAFADRTGLGPATSAVTGRHSNQLNYRSIPPCFRDGKDRRFDLAAKKFLVFIFYVICGLWMHNCFLNSEL